MTPVKLLAVAGLTASIAACTAPIDRELTIDGHRNANFDPDFRACYQIADNFEDGRTKEYATGGAVIGGIIGAFSGDDAKLENIAAGAAAGGLTGYLEAANELDEEKREVLIRCMQNRGHNVVG